MKIELSTRTAEEKQGWIKSLSDAISSFKQNNVDQTKLSPSSQRKSSLQYPAAAHLQLGHTSSVPLGSNPSVGDNKHAQQQLLDDNKEDDNENDNDDNDSEEKESDHGENCDDGDEGGEAADNFDAALRTKSDDQEAGIRVHRHSVSGGRSPNTLLARRPKKKHSGFF